MLRDYLRIAMAYVPHPHWWAYFWDDEFAAPGEEDYCRECRLCTRTTFAGTSRRRASRG